MFIIGIEKNKNILTISLRDGGVYKIDFLTGDIIGKTGRRLGRNPFQEVSLAEEIEHKNLWKNFLFSASFTVNTYTSLVKRESIQTMEKFIPYLDLIEPEAELPESIPAGYVKWCRENGEKIDILSYSFFLSEKMKYTKKDRLKVKSLTGFLGNSNIDFIIRNKDFRSIFFKILDNDAKIYNFSAGGCIGQLFFFMKNYGVDLAAENLGIKENLDIYKTHLNENRNKLILQNEDKIKDLENIQHEKFCVVVPKSLQDFTNEGEQQRNCVGHYYHNSIAQGYDLIYFVRLKENPKKSLNTCRYNVTKQKTIENKTFCNRCSSKEVTYFIRDIVDPVIREILSK